MHQEHVRPSVAAEPEPKRLCTEDAAEASCKEKLAVLPPTPKVADASGAPQESKEEQAASQMLDELNALIGDMPYMPAKGPEPPLGKPRPQPAMQLPQGSGAPAFALPPPIA